MQVLRTIILILCCLPVVSFGQTAFFKVYSSGHFDVGEGICQLPDSSYLVTGSSGGFNTSSPQAFIMKIDKKGQQIWTVDKGGEEFETGRRIFYLDNKIYVLGRTNSFGKSFDYYFLALDSTGVTLDEKAIGTEEYEWLQDAIYMPQDSTFILYGFWLENDGFSKKMQLTKINKSGEILWQLERPMALEAELKNMHVLSDSTFGIVGNQYNFSTQLFEAFYFQYDYNANILDSLLYSNGQDDHCFNDFSLTHDKKHILFVGSVYRKLTSDEIRNHKSMVYNVLNRELVEDNEGYDENYNRSFEYIISKSAEEARYYVIERSKKSVYPTYFEENNEDAWDEYILKYFGNNIFYWEKSILNASKSGEDRTNQVITTLDGGVVTVGFNENFANNARNVFIIKLGPNDENVGGDPIPEEETLLHVEEFENDLVVAIFPNPVKDWLKIQFEEELEISIYDSFGKHILNSNASIIDFSTYQSGIYFLNLRYRNAVKTVKIIKE